MRLEPTESQLVNLILRRLYFERHWVKVWRANAGKVRLRDAKTGKDRFYQGNVNGCPDIIGFFAPLGRFIGIEVKVGKNDQKHSQELFEEECLQKNALYVLVRSLDDIEKVINILRPSGIGGLN